MLKRGKGKRQLLLTESQTGKISLEGTSMRSGRSNLKGKELIRLQDM